MSTQIEINKKLVNYLQSVGYRQNPIIDALVQETKALGEVAIMQIAPEQGQLLEIIVKIAKAKRCLEIGRFTGLSTLCMAKGLPEDGKVIAVDKSASRLATLKGNLARLKLKANSVVADAVTWRPDSLLDAVLIDAPCTATGNIRRHPDIQHLKSLKDVESVGDLQRTLLDAAIEMVKPGGKIIYTTCSLQPDEGPEIINAFLASGVPVKRQPILLDEVGGRAELLNSSGDLRTLPCHFRELGGMDGFFAAQLIHN